MVIISLFPQFEDNNLIAFFAIVLMSIVFLLFMRSLFIKVIYHFRLLKVLYPKLLSGLNFIKFYLFGFTRLGFGKLLWFWMPIYFGKESRYNYKGEEVILYHKKLISNNYKMLIYFLIFFALWLSMMIYLK